MGKRILSLLVLIGMFLFIAAMVSAIRPSFAATSTPTMLDEPAATLSSTPIYTPTPAPTPPTPSTPYADPLPTAPLLQVNHYVALTGDDANPGTIERPWRTIQYAVDQSLPGDTIYLRKGSFLESVVIKVSGTEGAPITLTSFVGEPVVIDGGADNAIQTRGAVSYWVVDGLTLRSASRYTLRLGWWGEASTDHWVVKNNHITGANFLRGSYHLWENNDISGVGYTESQGDGGISDGEDSHHNIYRGNQIHDFTHKNARGIWTQGETHDSLIENNTITNIVSDHDSIRGQCIDLDGAGKVEWRHIVRGNRLIGCNYVGIQLENAFETLVENNMIMDADSAGIIVINYGPEIGCLLGGENNQYGDTNGDGDCRGEHLNTTIQQNVIHGGNVGGIVAYGASVVRIYNNTVSGANTGLYLDDPIQFTNNWDVRCNIFSNTGTMEISMEDAAALVKDDYNLLFHPNMAWAYEVRAPSRVSYSLAAWTAAFGLGQHSLTVDPLFFEPEALNFHLQPGSPAVDAGIDLNLTTDLDGRPRPFGGGFDLGAYEQGAFLWFVFPLVVVRARFAQSSN